MTMSRDRIKFKLQFSPHSTEIDANMEAASRAFSLDHRDAKRLWVQSTNCSAGAIIICRPSQFARFLIYRMELGGQNLFKQLEPQIIEQGSGNHIFQVAENPRCD